MTSNGIYQWSVLHPYLATIIAYFALAVVAELIYRFYLMVDNMLMRFRWWMIAGRLRDKDGNITRENIDSFRELVDKIEENDKHKKSKED